MRPHAKLTQPEVVLGILRQSANTASEVPDQTAPEDHGISIRRLQQAGSVVVAIRAGIITDLLGAWYDPRPHT